MRPTVFSPENNVKAVAKKTTHYSQVRGVKHNLLTPTKKAGEPVLPLGETNIASK